MVEFSFGMPVGKGQFFDRKEELGRLVGLLEKIKKSVRNDIAIIGPRRVGKSSLTNRLAELLKMGGISIINIDCEGLTLPIFLREYSNAIIEAEIERGLAERFRERTKQGISATIEILSEVLGRIKAVEIKSPLIDFISLRIELEGATAAELKEERLYDFFSKTMELPDKLGKKYVVIMDEFQETATYSILKKGDFHALFRRVIQSQKNVAYVYTGSSIGMMGEIFGNPKNPLAGNADIMQLGPFSRTDSKDFIRKGLAYHNKTIEAGGLDLIFERTGGFPAYLNWVGLRLIESNERTVTEKYVKGILEQMLRPISAIYQSISKQLIRLGAKTKRILALIALGNKAAGKLQKESGAENIYVYLNRLQNYGLVKKEGNMFYIIDPLILEGLRRGIF